jgi:hypothetical protein
VGCDGFFVGFWFHGDWMDGGGGGGGVSAKVIQRSATHQSTIFTTIIIFFHCDSPICFGGPIYQ